VLDNQLKLVFAWHQDILTGKLIKNIAIATLILNGEADIIVPPVNSIILASTIRHAELMRWKQGGHAMEFQYPVEMANAINQFLANEGQH
jgi:pimeloyl-ACP methyl ester carboxylesterase